MYNLFSILYHIISFFCKKKNITFYFSPNSQKFQNLICLTSFLKEKNIQFKIITDDNNKLYIIYIIATSKIIIQDQSLPFTSKIHLHPNTKFLQCWHGGGAYKCIGHDAYRKTHNQHDEFKRVSRIHRNISYLICSDPTLTTLYANIFKIKENQVLALGLPRTDNFFSQNIEKNKVQLNIDFPSCQGKKIILYAPTYRQTNGRHHINNLDLQKLQNTLSSNYCIAIRKHPTIKINNLHNVLDFSELPLNFALSVTDILITDYSSILFDFSIFKKPILIYAEDLNNYIETERCLYVLPEDLAPNCVCYSVDEIINKIKNGIPENFIYKNYMSACDGHSTERISKFILDIIENKGK